DSLAADIEALIELLRDLHGARCVEAEIGRGGLLQCRGGEGRSRVAPDRLRLDAIDHIGGAVEQSLEAIGVLTGLDRTVLQALAVGRYEARLELVAARRLQEGGEIPVFFRDEALDLRFPVADEA